MGGFSTRYSLTGSGDLRVGTKVRIKGLFFGGHLNGQLGEIAEIRGATCAGQADTDDY